nr:hypothetical protein [Desulfovibrio sp.]
MSFYKCLRLAAAQCGLPAPESEPVRPETVTQESLREYAAALGLDAEPVQGEDLETIASRRLRGPVLLPLKNGSAVLFSGRLRGKPVATVIDPATEPPQQGNIGFEELAKHWTGQALLLSPHIEKAEPDEPLPEMPLPGGGAVAPKFSLAFFMGEIRRMRKSLAEVGLAAVGLQLV